MRTSVYLSLGSNLGDRLETLKTALILIHELPDTAVMQCSTVYDTVPVHEGGEEQPVYANMAAHIKTALSPDELLTHLMMIESDMGRERIYRHSPRTLDIDILLYGNQRIETDLLTVPHPRMLERDFVMTPLLEIAPDAMMPDGKKLTKEKATKGKCLQALGAVGFPL